MGPIPSHIRFNETDRFIKIYDEIRYLQLLNNHVCSMLKFVIRLNIL